MNLSDQTKHKVLALNHIELFGVYKHVWDVEDPSFLGVVTYIYLQKLDHVGRHF